MVLSGFFSTYASLLHIFFVYLQHLIFISMAKNLLNKYVWLVETIYKAKRITFEEINEKWLENDMSEGVELALRTFHKWRIAAEEMFGLIIECERKGGYHYYIANSDDIKSGSLRSWLLNTLSVSNLLIDNQVLKDRIILENVSSGQEYLAPIFEAMKKNLALHITYQSYWKEESFSFDVEPYKIQRGYSKIVLKYNEGSLDLCEMTMEEVVGNYTIYTLGTIKDGPIDAATFTVR